MESRGALAALLATCALLIGACGGGGGHSATSTNVQTSAPRVDGLVNVHKVTYKSSFDGSRVTALVAVPRAVPSRGCVIWEFGFGSKKEQSSQAWDGLASLGLSTFSIDLRYQGARATSPQQPNDVLHNPNLVSKLIRGTVGDLHSAIDYLEKQPYCWRNVAYAGVSLGGAIGTILAATDKRVKAAVLMVTPGTWRGIITAPDTVLLPGIVHHPAKFAAALKILSPLDPARYVGRISPRPVLIVSGLQDTTVLMSNSRVLQAAARKPKTIVDYNGGHNPNTGPAAVPNGQAVASFLLRNIVEPTYGIAGNPNGTFLEQ